MGLADTGVADLAVVVAPVGVVHIVAHQVVNLLSGTILGSALARSGHKGKAELVLLIEFLLNGSVVTERTVENAFDPVVSAKPCGCAESVGPAVVKLAGSIGQHQTKSVQGAVGQHATPPTRADGRSHRHNVREAVVATESEIRNLGSVHGLLASDSLVETAPQRVRSVARDCVVHPHTCKVNIL